MSIKEIFCQDRAIGILQKAYALDKQSHAYIFAGLDGVGKFKTAQQWAKILLCEKPKTKKDFADSCGQCESCRLFEADSHPDFHHIYKELREFTRDGKGKLAPVDLAIDVIREFLIEKVSSKPTVSKRKIFVISEGERLNASSQNAMLKSLEEPPEYCTIILLCTRLEKLLPTTKSRCQTIRFSPIDEDKIIEQLKAMGLADNQTKYFGKFAQGSLGQGCKLAELELAGAKIYEAKRELIKTLARFEYADALVIGGQFQSQSKVIAGIWAEIEKDVSKTAISRRAAKLIVQIVISALYDAMRIDLIGGEKIINFDQTEQIKILARQFDIEQCSEKIANCYQTMRWIESSVNEKLIFEQLLLNLGTSATMGV
ncbi:MAG: DNA polymerase III subunit [Planctomycetes bacterium]|nr:DNA polymerase III subunit [Planctomycetota bacterium]